MASKLTAAAVSLSLVLVGCASSSDKIAASYVPHYQYQNFNCDQLFQETERVRAAAIAGGAQLDKAAQNDSGIVAVGMVLFWPALFFVGGNQAKEAEYARLKGEMEALDRARVEKNCVAPTPLVPVTQEASVTEQPAPTVQHIKITHDGQPSLTPAAEVSVVKPTR